jgi:hypothetical protein
MNFSPSQLYSPSEMLAASNNILYGQPAISHFSFNTPVIPSAPNTTPIQPRAVEQYCPTNLTLIAYC